MPKPGTSADPPARCPRCAYDLTGHVAAWRAQCPTRGQCSECGLEFNWGDVLNAAMRDLPWLYEHAPHWWSLRRAWGTAFRALFPWSLWGHLELHHRVRPSRLLLWLPLIAVSLYLIAASVVAASLMAQRILLPLPAPVVFVTNPTTAPPSTTVVAAPDNRRVIITTPNARASVPIPDRSFFVPELHQTAIGPVLLAPGGRTGHWRITAPRVFGGGWKLISPNGAEYDSPFTIVSVRRPFAPPRPTISDITLGSLGALFRPGRATYGLGVVVASVGFTRVSPNPPFWAVLAFMGIATCIVAAAPSEWKRARVRSAHLVRIAALSAAPLAFLLTLHLLIWIWAEVGTAVWNVKTFPIPFGTPLPQGPSSWAVPPLPIALLASNRTQPHLAVALAIWLPLFWWFAFKRGMKLERPFVLWLFVTIGGLLAYVITLNAMDKFFTHLFI